MHTELTKMKLKKKSKNRDKFQLISPIAFTVQKYRANVGVPRQWQTYNGKGHGIYTEKCHIQPITDSTPKMERQGK